MKSIITRTLVFIIAAAISITLTAVVFASVVDNADIAGNWTSSKNTTTVSQETTIKKEGTGSVKIQGSSGDDTTLDLMEYADDSAAQAAYVKLAHTSNTSTATGGTITTSGAYKIHKFTSNGTFTPGNAMDVEVLLVAGGGGGGKSCYGCAGGGGGGGGGMLTVPYSRLAVTGYAVTVGGVGAGATTDTAGTNGGNSVFNGYTAIGGGGGGAGLRAAGKAGGSGGGGAYNGYAAGAGTAGQGNAGASWTAPYSGGGGGGAGAAGSGTTGGAGLANSITGSSVTYARGGNTHISTTHGAANTGNGGSGGYGGVTNGGNGGSGVVIIRYLIQPETVTDSSTHRTHVFKSYDTFNPGGSINVETLVVAGGGGGGKSCYGCAGGGGGGAGGYLYSASLATTTQSYPISVGGGGIGARSAAAGTNGSNSIFSSLTAIGGGGGGAGLVAAGKAGGSGGGGAYNGYAAGAGTAGQGNAGASWTAPYSGGGGGGAGAAGSGTTGGAGLANSITGSSVTYARGGNTHISTTHGAANTGNGGSGGYGGVTNGGIGGSGIVVIKYPAPILAYSEGSIKTQGSYSLKGVANANAVNKTLTRTVSPTLNLAGHDTINFDIRSSRTGSNIKIGIHDSGGTTTEITPNITSANVFQAKSWDISGVSDANKDAIDKIIITIVNASAANTFYIDDMIASSSSLNDTVTLTKSATDLSTEDTINFWVRSSRTGQFMQLQMGESAASEQTYNITINSANTWEQKIWDISAIPSTSRDAITKLAFKVTDASSAFDFYFDDIQHTSESCGPSLGDSAHTVIVDCSFSGYTSITNGARILTGLDSGASTTNTSTLTVENGILTINSNESMVTGSVDLTGGSIAIAEGGEILVGSALWAIDADDDGYPTTTAFYSQTNAPTNGVRLNTIASKVGVIDCDDSFPSSINSCLASTFGSGNDGAVTFSANTNLNTTDRISGRDCTEGGDAVNYSVTGISSLTVTLSTTPSTGCLAYRDEVLLINLQGTASNSTNVGNYEVATIDAISGNTVTLSNIDNYYGDGVSDHTNIGTATTNQRVMLQRVPNYTTATINSSVNVYPSAWNGTKGGVLVFKAATSITNNGTIHANNMGYRAGTAGANGESICKAASGGANSCGGGTGAWGSGNNPELNTICQVVTSGYSGSGSSGGSGGGGGGAWGWGTGRGYAGGGGGGSYGTAATGGIGAGWGGRRAGGGSAGGTNSSGNGGYNYVCGITGMGGAGGGGGTYGDSNLTKLYLGSGGGGGGNGDASTTTITGLAGGTGGGILYLASPTITNNSVIQSNGQSATATTWPAGKGGGGAGGSILIEATTTTLGTMATSYGTGGANHVINLGGGGTGGYGRIAIDADSITGTSTPTYTAL